MQAANKAIRATLLESPCVTETNGGNDGATKCRRNFQFFSPKEEAELGIRELPSMESLQLFIPYPKHYFK